MEVTSGKALGGAFADKVDVIHAVFSQDGKRLVTAAHPSAAPKAADPTEVQAWDPLTGKMVGPLVHLDKGVVMLAISPDGQRVAAATGTAVKLWNPTTGLPNMLSLEHPALVFALDFSLDGKLLAAGCEDGSANVWDAAKGELIRAVKGPEGMRTCAVAFSPDSLRLLIGGGTKSADRGYLQHWALNAHDPISAPTEEKGEVMAAAFSPDGRNYLTRSLLPVVNLQFFAECQLWDTSTQQPAAAPFPSVAFPLSGNLVFSPDSKIILNMDGIGAVSRRRRPGQPQMLQHDGALGKVALSQDGKILLTCVRKADWRSEAHVWDAVTRVHLAGPIPFSCEPDAADLSPDGKTIAIGTISEAVQFWDAATGMKKAAHIAANNVQSLAFSPDGTRLVTATRDAAELWDAAAGSAAAWCQAALPPTRCLDSRAVSRTWPSDFQG